MKRMKQFLILTSFNILDKGSMMILIIYAVSLCVLHVRPLPSLNFVFKTFLTSTSKENIVKKRINVV